MSRSRTSGAKVRALRGPQGALPRKAATASATTGLHQLLEPPAAVLGVSVVVYLLSFVLMLALLRHREFAARRGAAVTTGRPSALASIRSTHPPTKRRISALQRIEAALHGSSARAA